MSPSGFIELDPYLLAREAKVAYRVGTFAAKVPRFGNKLCTTGLNHCCSSGLRYMDLIEKSQLASRKLNSAEVGGHASGSAYLLSLDQLWV